MNKQLELLELIKELPNSRVEELAEFFPDKKLNAVSAACSVLYAKGLLLREKVPNSLAYTYTVNPNPKPPVRELKRKTPTNNGLAARCDEYTSRIFELEDWKARAIARYPDLAVAEEVIEARKIAASTLKEMGDKQGSVDILAGHRDNSPIMLAVIKALGG